MSYIAGRGRTARETYPDVARGSAPFQNRNIAPIQTLPGFTPGAGMTPSLIGAIPVTPKGSGIFMVFGILNVITGDVGTDIYGLEAVAATGPGLSVSGGNVTVNGWTFGTTTPPVIGGAPVLQANPISLANESIGGNSEDNLVFVGMNAAPLPPGVVSVIELLLAETGGGNVLNSVSLQASLFELP